MLLESIMQTLNDPSLAAQAKADRLRSIMQFEDYDGRPIPKGAVRERLRMLLEEEFRKVKTD
jgi:hypothetical protein